MLAAAASPQARNAPPTYKSPFGAAVSAQTVPEQPSPRPPTACHVPASTAADAAPGTSHAAMTDSVKRIPDLQIDMASPGNRPR